MFGKSFVLAYSFGDCLTVCNNWLSHSDIIEDECQFTIQDSLHGREILTVCGFDIGDNKTMILTGSEDTYFKVSEYSEGRLMVKQTFCNHVASIRDIIIHEMEPSGDIDDPNNSKALIMTVGSRMQANIFSVTINK